MDPISVMAFPWLPDASEQATAPALVEIDAAISLVAGRVAQRIRLVSLPDVEAVAAMALAHAQAAGVAFALDRDETGGPATVTIGPRA